MGWILEPFLIGLPPITLWLSEGAWKQILFSKKSKMHDSAR